MFAESTGETLTAGCVAVVLLDNRATFDDCLFQSCVASDSAGALRLGCYVYTILFLADGCILVDTNVTVSNTIIDRCLGSRNDAITIDGELRLFDSTFVQSHGVNVDEDSLLLAQRIRFLDGRESAINVFRGAASIHQVDIIGSSSASTVAAFSVVESNFVAEDILVQDCESPIGVSEFVDQSTGSIRRLRFKGNRNFNPQCACVEVRMGMLIMVDS